MAFEGTTIDVPLDSVVDGDTIKVKLPDPHGVESIRILAIDTEEKPGSGGSKPKTPFGQAATVRAQQFFGSASTVTLEFPGTEPAEVAMAKYRGNFGRVLAFVHLDGVDFQETMIEEGFSPYFMKYGNASFAAHHARYKKAERAAQRAHVGVWNQVAVNGEERRNYASLSTWWTLRAELIDRYRAQVQAGRPILNTRLDYETIKQKAGQQATVTLFTEVARFITINNGSVGFVDIGSEAQPFTLFLPGLNQPDGTALANLLRHRYIADGPDSDHPRRSYVYVTGALSLFQGEPQMVVTSVDQLTDDFPSASTQPTPGSDVSIAALLPNPAGPDAGNETVTLRNGGAAGVSIDGWTLRDKGNHEMALAGSVPPGGTLEITVQGSLSLNNTGDEITLRDDQGAQRSQVSYTAAEVQQGQPIFF